MAGRLEAESKQPRLRASRIELVHSFRNRVSEPHAFTETCQRRAELAPLSSPEWGESVCSDHTSSNHLSGVVSHPRHQTRASIAAFQHVFLDNCLRRSHEASDSQDGSLNNPIACRVTGGLISSTMVVPSARSSRTRRMSSQMLGLPGTQSIDLFCVGRHLRCGVYTPRRLQ